MCHMFIISLYVITTQQQITIYWYIVSTQWWKTFKNVYLFLEFFFLDPELDYFWEDTYVSESYEGGPFTYFCKSFHLSLLFAIIINSVLYFPFIFYLYSRHIEVCEDQPWSFSSFYVAVHEYLILFSYLLMGTNLCVSYLISNL